jgi:hypothetical protein
MELSRACWFDGAGSLRTSVHSLLWRAPTSQQHERLQALTHSQTTLQWLWVTSHLLTCWDPSPCGKADLWQRLA